MMMVLLYFLFMILMTILFDCWFICQLYILVVFILSFFFSMNYYFSNISYMFGIDMISMGFVILCMLITSLMILSSNLVYLSSGNYSFLFICLCLCLSIVLFFSVMNVFLMYLLFELSLILMIILLMGWGYQPERLLSGFYLLFYTVFSSLPLLLIIMNLYKINMGTFFDYTYMSVSSFLIYFFMIISFLVKAPMFMLHFWLPKAHVQASVAGSMILAGLMLKLGGYGVVRFMWMFELAFFNYSYIFYSLIIWGSLLVGLISLVQSDMKSMVAYSSISHMGLCLLGLMSMSTIGIFGSFCLMIGHGICSSGLFCLVNMFYDRLNSRSFFLIKGMILYMPSLSVYWFFLCVFNMSCPPSLNFFGEILILVSMMSYWLYSSVYFLFISFFCSCFSFYLYLYSQHGLGWGMYSFSIGGVREFLILYIHVYFLIVPIFILDFF